MLKTRNSLFGVLLATLLSIPFTPVFASEKVVEYESPQQIVETIFEEYDADDKFLKMPDGGYLHGQAKIVDAYDNSIVYGEYDSETDPNAVSIEVAKEDLINFDANPQIETRGAGIPNKTKVLAAGASYTSSVFTASGWRFSDYFIQAAAGTSGNLQWTTYNDSALIGDMGDALNTLNTGSGYGRTLYPGVPYTVGTKMNGWYQSMVYFTYNPTGRPYYHVKNLV